ncbi:hypothetical protein C8Q76DRAFT_801049 [Earliella scabrosa]|nr:hypothetical protein C8Q76DRAFT_801049 [Earliella scabrosa]
MASTCAGTEAYYVLLMDTKDSTHRLISTVLSTGLFGVATSLAVASTYILIGKGLNSPTLKLLLCATLVLYASTTTFWTGNLRTSLTFSQGASAAAQAVDDCDVQAFFNPLRASRVQDQMACIETAALTINVCDLLASTSSALIAILIFGQIQILVGDAIVWWRALLLWHGRSKGLLLALCIAFLLSTFALSIADTCQACNLDLVREEAGYGQLFSGTKLGAAASIMSFATNAMATMFTAYKAWEHARLLRSYFSRGKMTTNVERILILLTESGLVYGAIWLLVVIYQVGINKGTTYDESTFQGDYWGIIGYFVNGGLVPTIAIYPMAIIVLVALQKSQMENSFSIADASATDGRGPVLSTHIIALSPTSLSPHSPRFVVGVATPTTRSPDSSTPVRGWTRRVDSDGSSEAKQSADVV